MREAEALTELVARLRERYATGPPPCWVCGGELSLQAGEAGESTVWACTGPTAEAEFELTGQAGDADVLALCEAVVRLALDVGRLETFTRGLAPGWSGT